MTNKDLFNAFENTDEKFIDEALPKNSRKGIILKTAAAAACICLIAAAGVFTLKNNAGITDKGSESLTGGDLTPNGSAELDGTYTPNDSDKFSGNYTPNGNLPSADSSDYAESSSETAAVLPWDELTLPEKFPEAEISSEHFSGRNKTLPGGKIGGKISALTLTGRDEITGKAYTSKAEAFEIKGISPACAAAVKFSGTNEYYVYINPYYQPETLGQFIADLDLKNTLTVGTVYENRFNGKKEYITAEYTGLTVQEVFDRLLNDAELPAVKNFDSKFFGSDLIGISINIELLGYENISLAVTEEGYITTNILDTGKAFFIGREKAEGFYKYVTQNCRRTKYEVSKPQTGSSETVKSGDAVSHAAEPYIPE